jgi:hypothetical protein
MVIPDAPPNLIGDNTYDSDHLDAELRFYGIELIASTSPEPKEFDSGWTSAEAIPTKVENRAAVCLVAELPASGR